jgi:hypothetical protein
MILKSHLCTVAAALTIAGCATTPTYQSYKAPDAACIQGDVANVVKFFSDGEAHVAIREIDGVPSSGTGPHCVTPGKHRLGISGYNNYQTAQDYVNLDFEAGKQYWLRGNLRGISIVFQLVDITSQAETKIGEFSIKVNSTSQPGPIIPIFIPIKR